MTLGAMIRALEHCKPDAIVRFDFCGMVPGQLDSYRGYYEELALGFKDSSNGDVTVSDLLAELNRANGKTFTGWKGGDYVMGLDTPVWVDNPGHSNGTTICGIRDCDWKVIIDTWCVP